MRSFTEVCRLVVTNFATRIRACAEFQFKIPTKSEHMRGFSSQIVTTNLQTSVLPSKKDGSKNIWGACALAMIMVGFSQTICLMGRS